MSMNLIIIMIIVIVVVGVGAAVTLRREPDDSPKDVVPEPARQDTDNTQRSEPPAREEWPPRASPVPPTPTAPTSTAPAPPDVARQGFEMRSNPVLGQSPGSESDNTLWNDGTIHGYQDRWGKVQLQFIDDPHNAAAAAEALITDVINSLAATVNARKNNLDAWRSSKGADTEELRMVVRRYRDFLDRVLGA
jgi:hypothetical protein